MNQHHEPIVIVSAVRTPIGHFGGVFKDCSTILCIGGGEATAIVVEMMH